MQRSWINMRRGLMSVGSLQKDVKIKILNDSSLTKLRVLWISCKHHCNIAIWDGGWMIVCKLLQELPFGFTFFTDQNLHKIHSPFLSRRCNLEMWETFLFFFSHQIYLFIYFFVITQSCESLKFNVAWWDPMGWRFVI